MYVKCISKDMDVVIEVLIYEIGILVKIKVYLGWDKNNEKYYWINIEIIILVMVFE